MRHLAWSLWVGALAGLGAAAVTGPFFPSTAYAQKGAVAAPFGNAGVGTPLGNQQLLVPGNPGYGFPSPGSVSPSIGGVNSNGAVVGGTANGGMYGSPGSFSPGIGGVNANGAVIGGYLNGGMYGSPGSMISSGVGGVNGNGAVVGGSLNGGVYGSPGSIISPGIGGVNGNGAVVGGYLNRGVYGSPGSFSPTIGGVNGRGAAVAGSLNSGFKGFQNGEFGTGEFNGNMESRPFQPSVPFGLTGPSFFPGVATVANNGNVPATAPANVNNALGGPPTAYFYNPAPLILEAAEEGRFAYSWW